MPVRNDEDTADAMHDPNAPQPDVAEPLPDPRIVEPTAAHDEVTEVLGADAKPTGLLRFSQHGATQRLQQEWVSPNGAAWFNVVAVPVDALDEIRPPAWTVPTKEADPAA